MKKCTSFIIIVCALLNFNQVVFSQSSIIGQWAAPIVLPVEGVHSGALHTGDIILYSYRHISSDAPYYVFDPASPLAGVSGITSNVNYFCGGMTVTADGRYLMHGGLASQVGHEKTGSFNPVTGTWDVLTDSNRQRWYPSTIMLGDGSILTMGGTNLNSGPELCEFTAEVYNPTTNTWTMLNGGAVIPDFKMDSETLYPRIHLLPDQPGPGIYRVFQTGTYPDTRIWEVNLNTYMITTHQVIGPWANIPPVSSQANINCSPDDTVRFYMESVRLHDGRFMAIDGQQIVETDYKGSDIIDLSAPIPTWQALPNKPGPDTNYQDVALLPNGHVFVIGGGGSEAFYDPVSNAWTASAPMVVNRIYHSTCVLMPDGRVTTSGGTNSAPYSGPGAFGESAHMEMYSPPYLFNGARPVITSAPTTAVYGDNINVPYTSTGGSISKVALHRPGTQTHHFSYNMIGVPLSYTDSGSALTVSIPSNPNLIPPGYYLLFILSNNSGVEVPSVAKWIKISGTAPGPDSNAPSQPSIDTFTNVTENSLTVQSTVSIDAEGSLPVQYQFDETSGNTGGTDSAWQNGIIYTDTDLVELTQYCYRVRSRDSAGTPNETSYSNSVCQSTIAGPDTTPPSPNPATFISSPVAIGDAVISMTATTASDDSLPIEYNFDETSGNSGGTDSGWQQSSVYYDHELMGGTQYCYMVQSRDGQGNTTAASANSCATTAVEDGFTDVSVGPGQIFTPANITINVGDTVQWTFLEDGHNVWAGLSGGHNFYLNNPSQILFASSAVPVVTNPNGFVYSMTFDQTFLDNSTGDAGSANAYNYHCHIHGSGPPSFMQGTITINGGVDTAAPHPNPMTFDSLPFSISSSRAAMTASQAFDGQNSPTEYFFDETSGNSGGTDSGWQSSRVYEDSGLQPCSNYSYSVKARDALGFETTPSVIAAVQTEGPNPDINNDNVVNLLDLQLMINPWLMSGCHASNNYCSGADFTCDGQVTLDDVAILHSLWLLSIDSEGPQPNPATFDSLPAATSPSDISMAATVAIDASSPVDYFFDETSGNAGGTDSAWQASPLYSDTGLSASTQYCYTVQSRDSLGFTNTASVSACTTTDAPLCGSGQPFTDFLGAGQSTGINVTYSSDDEGESAGIQTVNGSGLTGNQHDTSNLTAWQSSAPSTDPVAGDTGHWIQYDFGHLYTLGLMHVWNHNESCCTGRGINSVTIYHSQDGLNWTTLGTYTFQQASGLATYTGFVGPDFGGICARYVHLKVNSNFSGDSFTSLSEVKFNLVP